jgi:hypothetical protein
MLNCKHTALSARLTVGDGCREGFSLPCSEKTIATPLGGAPFGRASGPVFLFRLRIIHGAQPPTTGETIGFIYRKGGGFLSDRAAHRRQPSTSHSTVWTVPILKITSNWLSIESRSRSFQLAQQAAIRGGIARTLFQNDSSQGKCGARICQDRSGKKSAPTLWCLGNFHARSHWPAHGNDASCLSGDST